MTFFDLQSFTVDPPPQVYKEVKLSQAQQELGLRPTIAILGPYSTEMMTLNGFKRRVWTSPKTVWFSLQRLSISILKLLL